MNDDFAKKLRECKGMVNKSSLQLITEAIIEGLIMPPDYFKVKTLSKYGETLTIVVESLTGGERHSITVTPEPKATLLKEKF